MKRRGYFGAAYRRRLADAKVWHDQQMGDRWPHGHLWVDLPAIADEHLQEQWFPTRRTEGMDWDDLSKAAKLRQQRKDDPSYSRI
jgi:hypothetical protein